MILEILALILQAVQSGITQLALLPLILSSFFFFMINKWKNLCKAPYTDEVLRSFHLLGGKGYIAVSPSLKHSVLGGKGKPIKLRKLVGLWQYKQFIKLGPMGLLLKTVISREQVLVWGGEHSLVELPTRCTVSSWIQLSYVTIHDQVGFAMM